MRKPDRFALAVLCGGLACCAHRDDASSLALVEASAAPVAPDPMLAPAAPPELYGDWQPSEEEDAVYRALSLRDPQSCEQVESLATEPVAVLLTVVDKAQMPPWAPLRAATCLAAGHGEAVRDELLSWVGSLETKGLAYVVLEQLDKMPEALAAELAAAALAGPNAVEAQRPIGECQHQAVRDLLP